MPDLVALIIFLHPIFPYCVHVHVWGFNKSCVVFLWGLPPEHMNTLAWEPALCTPSVSVLMNCLCGAPVSAG